MLQLTSETISAAKNISLGYTLDSFKIIESPGKIVIYDEDRDEGVSIAGRFNNNTIKKDLSDHFQRDGALRIRDIADYLHEWQSDSIEKIEGAYLNMPEEEWKRDKDKEVDRIMSRVFGDTAITFGITFPLPHDETKEAQVTFRREPDGIFIYEFPVKGGFDAARSTVDEAIKILDRGQKVSLEDVKNCLSSLTMENLSDDVWIKNENYKGNARYDDDWGHIKESLNIKLGKEDFRFEITDHYFGSDSQRVSLQCRGNQIFGGDLKTAKQIVSQTIDYFKNYQELESPAIVLNYMRDEGEAAEKLADILEERPHLLDNQLETAKKAGYVQGVCESIAAVGENHSLGKKLLTEMSVTKDMAKKFANPETYKALEQGIFAPQQKLEQTQGIKR